MPDYPAHASPAFTPIVSPRPLYRDRAVSDFKLNLDDDDDETTTTSTSTHPPLISPAFTPPQTPFHHHHSSDDANQPRHRQPQPILVPSPTPSETSHLTATALPRLPTVHCEVRARIPTTTGTEMFLHLYHNDVDEKEHLAIVFGPNIRSRSLDRPRRGETERDRMIRGAYVGTLFPGRTSSRRVDQIRAESGVRSPVGGKRRYEGEGYKMESASASAEAGEIDSSYPPELGPPMVRIHSEC